MDYIVIGIVAFLASILTFFSGFGLGTILTPAFILFFPVDLSIALTGVVHFLNNLFKLYLVGMLADKSILIRFGIPAVLAAFLGAGLLLLLTDLPALFSYEFWGRTFEVSPLKFVISLLLVVFAFLDLIPKLHSLNIKSKHLPVGGMLSGFFGGISGHQGALRSAFLIKAGLSKSTFIATSVVISSFIDFTRISVYATRFISSGLQDNIPLLATSTLAAFSGAYLGSKLLKKVTLPFVQKLVAIMLLLIAVALGLGWI
ncbi:sulfite exporter TauE/SafE family protein [Pleomorphovibrio marinus]|uniref:sulfite exporter TauE/SafE family protein n=1 Tax=Pleomorphovibrio marinus TaxID=2164132 RepID=UPI000E0A7A12|nr:sulfite exporter TauE/SafE family protein [Pleomorphovibrio marinus]